MSSYRKKYYKRTYRKKTYYKKTYRRYSGSFRGGRSYGVLYAYYLPPNYYNAIGYYSPMYAKIYYNGYGYNFYYRKTGYYAASPNAIMRGDVVVVNNGGGGIGGILGLLIFCCIVGFVAYLMCTGKCKGDADDNGSSSGGESYEEEEETVIEIVEEERFGQD